MDLRRVGLLLALLAVSGCTRIIYYAVIAPNAAVNDAGSCFRSCQMLRAAGTKQYLACLNTCPDVRVVRETECVNVPLDAQDTCTTEHNQTFSPAPVVALIIVGVVALFFAAAVSQPTTRPE